MKKLLKIDPQYPIGIGILILSIGGIFFDTTSDTGFGIILLGSLTSLSGVIIGFLNRK
tara:strand:- start:438 stop:611 length:174 start_codon:yes stop_codon:yes gene_type:complete